MVTYKIPGKTALVTGANRPEGIGAEIARGLAREGAAVFLHGWLPGGALSNHLSAVEEPGQVFFDQQSQVPINALVEEIRKAGGSADGLEGDLGDPALIPALFDRAEQAFGPVEILVNNAAGWQADTFLPEGEILPNQAVEMWSDRPEQFSPESFERNFMVSTRAPALMMVEFVNRFLARGGEWGRIINISTAGSYVFPSEVSYGASKFALESYTRSAAVELGPLGITVNVIAPGPVQTGWISPDLEKELLPTIPAGRLGVPEDIARLVLFLASEGAGYITGQKIYVGGGHGM